MNDSIRNSFFRIMMLFDFSGLGHRQCHWWESPPQLLRQAVNHRFPTYRTIRCCQSSCEHQGSSPQLSNASAAARTKCRLAEHWQHGCSDSRRLHFNFRCCSIVQLSLGSAAQRPDEGPYRKFYFRCPESRKKWLQLMVTTAWRQLQCLFGGVDEITNSGLDFVSSFVEWNGVSVRFGVLQSIQLIVQIVSKETKCHRICPKKFS